MSRYRIVAFVVAAAAGAFTAATGLGGVAVVLAHASLDSSVPAANSVLERGPTEVVLDFDDAVTAAVASVELFDADGGSLDVADPVEGDDGTIVRAEVPGGESLVDGLYAVVWRVTSDDGHVIEGSFAFQVGTASTGDSTELLAGLASDDRSAADTAYAIARFAALLGAVVLLGGGWWAAQRNGALAGRRSTRWVIGGAAVLAVCGSVAAFLAFVATVGDGPGGALRITTGRLLVARIPLLVLVALLPRARRWWSLAAVGTVLTFSAAGHPHALDPWPLWVSVDAVHLSAVAVWFGGLAVLATMRRRELADIDVESVARRFSTVATVAVPVAVVTGVLQTWQIAGGVGDIAATAWGRLLLVKVTLVVVVLGVAGAARWLVQHEGAWSLRRTMIVEAVVGVVVLGLVAAMVGTAPRAASAAEPFEATLAAGDAMVSVVLTPAATGSNELHVVVSRAGGALAPVDGLEARVSLPDAGLPVAPVTLTREGPDHFSGSVTFAQSGTWLLELIVSLDESSSTLVSTEVDVISP